VHNDDYFEYDKDPATPLFERRKKVRLASDVIRLKTGDFLLMDRSEKEVDMSTDIRQGVIFSKNLTHHRAVLVKRYNLNDLTQSEEDFYYTVQRLSVIDHVNILTPIDMFKTTSIHVLQQELDSQTSSIRTLFTKDKRDAAYDPLYIDDDIVYVLEELLYHPLESVRLNGFSIDEMSRKKQVFSIGAQLYSALNHLHENQLVTGRLTMKNIFCDEKVIKIIVQQFYKSLSIKDYGRDCQLIGQILLDILGTDRRLSETEQSFFDQLKTLNPLDCPTAGECLSFCTNVLSELRHIPKEPLVLDDGVSEPGLSAAMVETSLLLKRFRNRDTK